MKIYRFRAPGHSYGYIRANIFERWFLNKRIEAGDSGLESLEALEKRLRGSCNGPRNYEAQFVITPKKRVRRERDRRGEQPWKKCADTFLARLFPFRVRVALLDE